MAVSKATLSLTGWVSGSEKGGDGRDGVRRDGQGGLAGS